MITAREGWIIDSGFGARRGPGAALNFSSSFGRCSMRIGAISALGAFPITNAAGILFEKRFVVANPENQPIPSFDEEDFSDFLRSPESQRRIDMLTIGIAIVGSDQRIICSNKAFAHLLNREVPADTLFYDALGDPEIEGPDFCPFASVCHRQQPVVTSVRVGSRTFELTFSPHRASRGNYFFIVVEMRDVTSSQEISDTLRRLLEIGTELSDLPSHRLAENTPQERMDLLRQKVESGLRDILHYEICEIRLLEETTGQLHPFLAFGISREAASRKLFSSSNDNGITGYVAHNRVTYNCEETLDHPFYLPGSPDARSSLTVPLVWHDRVIGTCNVESRKPNDFSELDLYYLKIFMRDVAAALHTLNLLSYEKIFAVQMSLGAVVESISSPIDEILQDTAVLIDANLEQDPASVPARRALIEMTRVIRDQISLIRRRMTAEGTLDPSAESHPILNGRRSLVVDHDKEVARTASALLAEQGCTVESAPDALVALKMIRVSRYDAIICELKPAGGMSGYQFMLRLFDLYPDLQVPPLILSTEFGYDPGHTICSAKQKGLLESILKPFNRRALFLKLEMVINACGERDANGDLILRQNDEQGGVDNDPADLPQLTSAEENAAPVNRKSFFTIHESQRFSEWEKTLLEPGFGETGKSSEEQDFDDQSGFDAT